MVLPLWLSANTRFPLSILMIILLQESPIPMELFFTFFISCLAFSSKKGMKRYCCCSFSIPSPESIISTSKTKFGFNFEKSSFCWTLWKSSICFLSKFWPLKYYSMGVRLRSIIKSPLNLLYLTAFYMILNMDSWKLLQSALRPFSLKLQVLMMCTFSSRLLIMGEKGFIT